MNSSPSSSFTVTDTELRSNLEDYLDRVVEDSDKVIVNRGDRLATTKILRIWH